MLLNRYSRYIHKANIILSSYFRIRFVRAEIIRLLAGRECFVLGSAPDPNLTAFKSDSLLICVNGSAANAKKLGLPTPILTIVDFELLDSLVNLEKESRSVIIKNQLLRGLNLGTLISTQSNGSSGGSINCLNANVEKHIRLYKYDCMKIVHNITQAKLLEKNVHGVLSRGALAVLLCAWGCAKSVTFEGFKLFRTKEELYAPHFYENNVNETVWNAEPQSFQDWDTRSHSLADSALITQLIL